MKTVYLDYAAATPLDTAVLKAMQPYLTERFANPSSLHTLGRQQQQALEAARKQVARALGAKPTEIIFTSGSTEAANLAVQGVAIAHPHRRLVATTVEHESVLGAVAERELLGSPAGRITIGDTGVVDPAAVAAAIDDLTVLVCVQYANNEIGTIQPLAKIAAELAVIRSDRAARGVTTPLYLYCDAAQAGLLNLQVARLGVDLMSMGGSKLYGPAGSGFLYVRTGVQLQPLAAGGGQESGLRSGTENLPAAVGLAAALERIQAGRQTEAQRQKSLRDSLWKELSRNIDGVELNGTMTPRLPGNLNIRLAGIDGETLVAYLDKEGFAVATGSACTAAHQDPSHVLTAIGLSIPEAESSLRITLGKKTTKAETQRFAKELVNQVAHLRTMAKRP